jgi:hypothetical protein
MIEVQSNNLYSTGKVIVFDTGEQLLLRRKLDLSMFSGYEHHTIRQGDELTAIAYRYYTNKAKDASKLWWVIADVNSIFNPFTLEEHLGETLVIPNILELKLIIEGLQ